MPYVEASRRDILKDDPLKSDGPGDANYLFTLAYLKVWLTPGNQRYRTIHGLKVASFDPTRIDEINEVEEILIKAKVSLIDREAARALAFQEFYRRVGVDYEDIAIDKNGDLPEFEQAQDFIFEAYAKNQKGE